MCGTKATRGIDCFRTWVAPQDCIFEDRNVNAFAEVTGELSHCFFTITTRQPCVADIGSTICGAVLAAFVFWADANLGQLDAEAMEQATAILSRMRFPTIPSSALHNYWWVGALLFYSTAEPVTSFSLCPAVQGLLGALAKV